MDIVYLLKNKPRTVKLLRMVILSPELNEELDGFMWRYNCERRHSALNYETPLDKLKKIASLLPEL